MSYFHNTIRRRALLIKIIQENSDEMEYSNNPIGYCHNEDCSKYAKHLQEFMKDDILRNVERIERAISLIKKTLE